MRIPEEDRTPDRFAAGRTRGPRAALVATALILAAVGTANAVTPTAVAGLAPDAPDGWSVVFADDFTGAAGTGVDPARWLYQTGTGYPGGPGGWGTGEVETMTSSTSNVYHDGSGNLAIRPVRDAAGNWTSGRIETHRADFQPPVGGQLRVQARIQLPNLTGARAQGYWPAFWLLGEHYRGNYWNWPAIGEIDIMENVNGLDRVHGTLHCGVSPAGPCNETTGLGESTPCPGSPCQAAFHTYRVDWDRSVAPEQLRWYVDGALYHTVNAGQVDAATWSNATAHGFFLILNVAMGGQWPGNPVESTQSGVPMLVDHVGVYSTPTGGGGPSTTPTTPGPRPTPGVRDPYSPIQAESFDAQQGAVVQAAADGGPGAYVSAVADGDWLEFTNVDFGRSAARQFVAGVASGADGGVGGLVEVRLDSRANAPVGSFAIAHTGGWRAWRTVPANITAVTGRHTVYLTFTSGQPRDFVNIDWLSFGP